MITLNQRVVDWTDFGADPTGVFDSTIEIQNAVNFALTNSLPQRPLPGTYNITGPIFVSSGSYFDLEADGVTLVNTSAYPQITTTTPADTSIPTAISPGPMRGAAFYTTTNIYYARFVGLTFSGFRFSVACLQPLNSPTFLRCTFSYCNCGVFSYQTAQNFNLINCTSAATNNLFIGSATCFVNGSPFAGQDNYTTDELVVANIGDGYGSLAMATNSYWDAWFQGSILQPTIGSYSTAGSNYVYPYATTDTVCNLSGIPIYIPFRNKRACYWPMFKNLDIRGPIKAVFVINNSCIGLHYERPIFENALNGAPTGTPWIILGSVKTALFKNIITEISNPGYPHERWTGEGRNGGISEFSNFATYDACQLCFPVGNYWENFPTARPACYTDAMLEVTSSAGAVTANSRNVQITTESLTTAAGADYVLTLTNSAIRGNVEPESSSLIFASVYSLTNTTVGLAVHEITPAPAGGSCTIRIRNMGSAALNGTICINVRIQS